MTSTSSTKTSATTFQGVAVVCAGFEGCESQKNAMQGATKKPATPAVNLVASPSASVRRFFAGRGNREAGDPRSAVS